MTREEAIYKLEQTRRYSKYLSDDEIAAITIAIKILEQEPCKDVGEISDGYHTFNQLYHQRAILFATIVNLNKDKAWKSFKHADGKYCFDSNGEWFIVGVDTPQGSYTYHYNKQYWDIFDCEELQCGKEWDGHTEEDVTRLLSLQPETCDDAISRQAVLDLAILEVVDIDDIKALPSVTPQPSTGQWIQKQVGRCLSYWQCSTCGKQCNNVSGTQYFNYCPNCGCKMEVEKL